mgnify:CR=1 FL=1
MSPASVDSYDIAVLAPTGRDCELICRLLTERGLVCRPFTDGAELARHVEQGLGMAIITEEALTPAVVEVLAKTVARQPAWSDFPFVVMSGHGVVAATRPLQSLAELGNVTMLDRPVQTRTMVSAVRAALRAREKQYEARRAIEMRDRFLAMLGHELRNPLGAILFASEKLSRGESQKDRERHLDMVHRQTRLLARLVDDLLDVSRVTSGKIQLAKRVADLREVVDRAIGTLDEWVAARRMTVKRAFIDRPVWVDADVMRIEQVATNLLTNALKYTPEGGTIEVTVRVTDAGAELVVRDTGIGIAPDELEKIFELFSQVDTTIDRAQGGLGLGLTLVRTLVELHGGTVRAKSDGLGKGTSFIVSLPVATVADVASAPEPRPAPASALNIVVIEDNRDLREMLSELLVDEGHQVKAAAEGTSGLDLIVDSKPDLALVDIGLPGLDGYGVAEAVRRKMGKSVRMIALSGYGQPEDKARALRAGFDAHLTKPIDLDSLQAVLQQA